MDAPALEKIFRKSKVLTLDQVSRSRQCSIRTVQRQFAGLSVLRSYNKNSRYYTLADIPEFNRYGIWGYQSIYFSRFGDLRSTVRQLIVTSEKGLSGNEIGEIIRLQPRSFMNHFRDLDGVFREKYGGVYVYFSDDAAVYEQQSSKRSRIHKWQQIGDAVAVKLLVAYIKNPQASAEALSDMLLQEHRCRISPADIDGFLSLHDLLKKKTGHPPSGYSPL
jgi:AraC-like DNA-binding protein